MPDVRIIRAEISGKLAAIIALSLTKRPDTRYQDGDQFAADLRVVIADLAGDSVVIATTAQFSDVAHNGLAANYDVIQIANLD